MALQARKVPGLSKKELQQSFESDLSYTVRACCTLGRYAVLKFNYAQQVAGHDPFIAVVFFFIFLYPE